MEQWVPRLLFIPLAIGVWIVVRCLMWLEDFEGIRSEAEYLRDRRSRVPLDAATFYRRYYADSGIDDALVDRFRQFQAEFWEVPAELIRPQDNYILIAGEGDADEFIPAMEREFGIDIPDNECRELDGSFDGLLRFLAGRNVRA